MNYGGDTATPTRNNDDDGLARISSSVRGEGWPKNETEREIEGSSSY